MGLMNKILKEAKQIESRWKKMGLLDGILDTERMVATLLENQRLMNENPVDTSDLSAFKRIKIPLMRRIHPTMSWPVQSPIADVKTFPHIDSVSLLDGPTDAQKKRKSRWHDLRTLDDDWIC